MPVTVLRLTSSCTSRSSCWSQWVEGPHPRTLTNICQKQTRSKGRVLSIHKLDFIMGNGCMAGAPIFTFHSLSRGVSLVEGSKPVCLSSESWASQCSILWGKLVDQVWLPGNPNPQGFHRVGRSTSARYFSLNIQVDGLEEAIYHLPFPLGGQTRCLPRVPPCALWPACPWRSLSTELLTRRHKYLSQVNWFWPTFALPRLASKMCVYLRTGT